MSPFGSKPLLIVRSGGSYCHFLQESSASRFNEMGEHGNCYVLLEIHLDYMLVIVTEHFFSVGSADMKRLLQVSRCRCLVKFTGQASTQDHLKARAIRMIQLCHSISPFLSLLPL
jgi:hypothetical protein